MCHMILVSGVHYHDVRHVMLSKDMTWCVWKVVSVNAVLFANGVYILYVIGWIVMKICSFNNLVGISSWPRRVLVWNVYHFQEHIVHLGFGVWSLALNTCIYVWNSMISLDIYFVSIKLSAINSLSLTCELFIVSLGNLRYHLISMWHLCEAFISFFSFIYS